MNLKASLLVGCLVVAVGNVALAQDVPVATPEHEILHKDVGVWNAKMTIWMPGMDDPITAEGVETNRMLGDFWIVSEFKADIFGQAFEGRAQTGYNAAKEKYVGTWVDSMEMNMTMMEGSWDEESQTMTFMGKGMSSATGEATISKNVVVYDDDDHHTMTMYMKDGDDWVKGLQIEYSRKD